MFDLSYAYLIGTLLFAPLWLLFYCKRKDLDKKMLEISFLVGVFAVFWSPYFWNDYWHPLYLVNLNINGFRLGGIEDFLYGFFAGGIISVVYEELLGKRISMKKRASMV